MNISTGGEFADLPQRWLDGVRVWPQLNDLTFAPQLTRRGETVFGRIPYSEDGRQVSNLRRVKCNKPCSFPVPRQLETQTGRDQSCPPTCCEDALLFAELPAIGMRLPAPDWDA